MSAVRGMISEGRVYRTDIQKVVSSADSSLFTSFECG